MLYQRTTWCQHNLTNTSTSISPSSFQLWCSKLCFGCSMGRDVIPGCTSRIRSEDKWKPCHQPSARAFMCYLSLPRGECPRLTPPTASHRDISSNSTTPIWCRASVSHVWPNVRPALYADGLHHNPYIDRMIWKILLTYLRYISRLQILIGNQILTLLISIKERWKHRK